MFDTIIVGAGIGGLQLGALLAADGEKVLVLEKAKTVGGRARVVRKKNFVLDYGIHVIRFGPHSAISKTFRKLGHEIEYYPLGPSYVMDVDGKKKLFPTGPKAFLTSNLFSIFDKIKGLKMVAQVKMGDHVPLMEKSLEEWMRENNLRGGLKRYFHLVSSSMMVCPFIDKSSVGEMLTNMQKVLKVGVSVMYPRGGWQPLIDILCSKIMEEGEIRTGAKVTAIKTEKKSAKGVMVGDEFIPGKKVILTMPSLELPSIFPAHVDKAFVEKCRSNRPTAGIVLDYALNKKISDISGLCYLYHPMSFGMFISNLEPDLAPEGKQLLTWLQPVPEHKIKDREWAKKREEDLEKALFRFFPELKEAIEWKRSLHLPVVDGTEVNINQIERKRPGPVVPGIENLFLVGDSISAPGAGGDVGHEAVHLTHQAVRSF